MHARRLDVNDQCAHAMIDPEKPANFSCGFSSRRRGADFNDRSGARVEDARAEKTLRDFALLREMTPRIVRAPLVFAWKRE